MFTGPHDYHLRWFNLVWLYPLFPLAHSLTDNVLVEMALFSVGLYMFYPIALAMEKWMCNESGRAEQEYIEGFYWSEMHGR